MNITGTWKVTEVCVFGEDFSQSWRTAEDILADSTVSPLQKAFAMAAYQFEDDGTALSLMPKEVTGGEGEPFDDTYVIAQRTKWKEENGSLFIAALENGEDDWQEMLPAGEGFEVFGYQRISR